MIRFASLRQDRIFTERLRRDGKAFAITFGLQGLLKTISVVRRALATIEAKNPFILHGQHYRGGLPVLAGLLSAAEPRSFKVPEASMAGY